MVRRDGVCLVRLPSSTGGPHPVQHGKDGEHRDDKVVHPKPDLNGDSTPLNPVGVRLEEVVVEAPQPIGDGDSDSEENRHCESSKELLCAGIIRRWHSVGLYGVAYD